VPCFSPRAVGGEAGAAASLFRRVGRRPAFFLKKVFRNPRFFRKILTREGARKCGKTALFGGLFREIAVAGALFS
jgi:hypothetical protein